MDLQSWITIGLFVVITALVIFTGIKKQPGWGIVISIFILAGAIGFDRLKITDLGLSLPGDWTATILWGLGLGILLVAISTFIIEPAAEKLMAQPVDMKIFGKMQGNWKLFLLMLLIGGVLAPFLEEAIFRGFLQNSLAGLIGKTGLLAAISLLISSIVFGLAHLYQGKSGAVSTALLGLLLGDIFIWNGYNLWLPILTHAIINIIGLTLIYLGLDQNIKKLLWRDNNETGL